MKINTFLVMIVYSIIVLVITLKIDYFIWGIAGLITLYIIISILIANNIKDKKFNIKLNEGIV